MVRHASRSGEDDHLAVLGGLLACGLVSLHFGLLYLLAWGIEAIVR